VAKEADMTGVDVGLSHLRIARPTDDLEAVVRFYRDGLGLDLLYDFQGHEGFDGVMLGRAGAGYHLEFTRKAGHRAGKAPTEDNLLVFYLPDREEWQRAVERLDGRRSALATGSKRQVLARARSVGWRE
jgi:catechol 2,3-dioxygenase-like lactoylglutathione lyase family enzyme